MKRKLNQLILSLFTLLVSVGAFSSCDSMIATSLEGTWEGNMYFASYYDGRYYYSNYTEIEFLLDPMKFKTGRGFWVDYYSNAPWDYVANHFTWTVQDRSIYIHLMEDDYDIEIRDYTLDDETFYGYVFYEGEQRKFTLYHTSSPNWDEYHYGTGYYYDDYYYYSPKRMPADSVGADADSVPPMLKERPKRVLVPAAKE